MVSLTTVLIVAVVMFLLGLIFPLLFLLYTIANAKI